MTSCAATAAAATAAKRALNVQAANQHATSIAADNVAAAKHNNAAVSPSPGANIAGGAHAAMLGLPHGGA